MYFKRNFTHFGLCRLLDDNVNINLQKKLKKWKYNVSEEDQKKLTHEGEDEMLNLAKRMQNRFPSVFSRDYSNSSYKVCSKRCFLFVF